MAMSLEILKLLNTRVMALQIIWRCLHTFCIYSCCQMGRSEAYLHRQAHFPIQKYQDPILRSRLVYGYQAWKPKSADMKVSGYARKIVTK